MTENHLIAAHEIGHHLIGARRGMPATHVTIRRGSEYPPHYGYDPAKPIPSDARMAEILLAGWAGEAYILSHPRDCQSFSESSLRAQLRRARKGTGWPLGLFLGGGSDFGRIGKLGGCRLRWLSPNRTVAVIAAEIHANKDRFFYVIDILVREKYLTAEVLDALLNGKNWSDELLSKNINMELDYLKRKFFDKEDESKK